MSVAAEKELPKGWRRVQVKDVCQLVGKTIDPQQSKGETFEHYSIPSYDSGRTPVIEKGAKILSNKTEFPDGVVLFSKLNPRISRSWHVEHHSDRRRICSTEFLPILPNTSQLFAPYLEYAFREPEFRIRVRSKVAAATKSRERLKPEVVMSEKFLLPSLSEQKRIAAILTERLATVEQAQKASEARLEATHALPAAYLREVFESEEAKGWSSIQLGDLAHTKSGMTPSRSNPAYFSGQIPWVKTAELKDGDVVGAGEHVTELALEETSLTLLPVGTLLVAMYGQGKTRGRTGILSVEATTNQACFAIFPNEKFDPHFLQMWFMHNYQRIRDESEFRGGNQPNLNGEVLKSQEIAMPDAGRQRDVALAFHSRITQVNDLLETANDAAIETEQLPATLLRQAFLGAL